MVRTRLTVVEAIREDLAVNHRVTVAFGPEAAVQCFRYKPLTQNIAGKL